MKTSHAIQTSSASQQALAHRAHGIVMACALVFASTAAQIATATPCPPGYRGTYPHCAPGPVPAKPHRPYTMHSNAHASGAVPVTTKHHSYPIERKIVDPHTLPPHIGSGSVEHQAGASSAHGIIFVGGHSQNRIEPDKAALNPQPIPPGHSLRRSPHPDAPIENGGH